MMWREIGYVTDRGETGGLCKGARIPPPPLALQIFLRAYAVCANTEHFWWWAPLLPRLCPLSVPLGEGGGYVGREVLERPCTVGGQEAATWPPLPPPLSPPF